MEGVDELTAHLTTSAMVVYAIEWAKTRGFITWMTVDSKTTNRVVSAMAAAAVAFGIQASGDMASGWVIHVPGAASLAMSAWEWAKQYTLQQVMYASVIEPRTMRLSREDVRDISTLSAWKVKAEQQKDL